MSRFEHALVLPDYDFMDWFRAAQNYTQAFENVITVRSPAGNNLNRYKNVSAVAAPRVWFNDDPLLHIRRAYPVVVSIDVINAQTPDQLRQLLDQRVRDDQRYGTDENVFTRFRLEWMVDTFTLQVTGVFDQVNSDGRRNEGLDVAATAGTTVRAAHSGRVVKVETNTDNSLGYGRYVRIRCRADDDTRYFVYYTNLNNVQVELNQTVAMGDPIAACATDNGIKIVVTDPTVDTGQRYQVEGAIDPLPLLFVDGMTLHTSAAAGLNIRRGQSIQFSRVGTMAPDEVAYSLEPHGTTIRKTMLSERENRWINLDTQSGVTGFGAAWLLEARSSRSVLAVKDFNGINLDVLNRLGAPDPSRLGEMTYARLPYNVSMGRGSQDLNAAYDTYAPYIDALLNAGKRIILVYTHQTFGEGAGYVWPQMTSDRWRELSARYSDFVRQIAQQFRGRIAVHQIWNEQDAPPNASASVRMPAADYAGILSRAIEAIRTVDATTPIITGGHTGGPGNGANYARSTINAMRDDLRPDGIAVHPYGRGPDPSSKYAIFGHIDETVASYGAILPNRPLWFTEWGVLNARSEPAAAINTYAADFLKYVRLNHGGKVAAAVWYAWADTMDNGYGLVGPNDQPKQPLFDAYTGIS